MLVEFLDAKPLYYDEIDYGRMPRIYQRISKHFKLPKIIHIIGTNGKGTTGRFLATALYQLGYNTGHYTSPHILEFNERIWFNGVNVTMQELEQKHQELLEILTEKETTELSYFEYTTLLAMLFFTQKSDFVVLEAGLGGEHDATAVFQNELTLVTPIDKDHEAFLGENISEIADTKLQAIQKSALLAEQKYEAVYHSLEAIKRSKSIDVYSLENLLTEDDFRKIQKIAKEESLVSYLQENLKLAVGALKYFKIAYKVEDFYNSRLFGRLTPLSQNILVDVGHNVLAAESILQALSGEKYRLIYNSYKDKNYKKILSVLKPIIEEVLLIDVYNARIEESDYLQNTLNELGIEWKKFDKIESEKKYLVFGSFSVVESFLKVYNG